MDIYIKDPKIRADVVKVKIYRMFSFLFLGVGFLVFLMLYSSYMSGRSLRDLLSFYTVLIIILPYMPAAALSWFAIRLERKTDKAIDSYIEAEEKKKAEIIKAANENMQKQAEEAAQEEEEEPEVVFGPDGKVVVKEDTE